VDLERFGFYTQSGLQFKDEQKVIDVVRDIAEYIPLEGKGGDLSASQLLERFLFSRAQQHDFVAKLSGGEKRRLYLLTILMDNPNFLILDEPTNDLDLLTLNVLEDFLLAYQGCLIVVTHDRYFMDKLTDHLFVFTGDGSIRDFPGNYSEYRRALELEEETNRLRNQVRKSPAPKSPKAPAEKAKTSLTYAERLEIEALEKELPSLEEKRNQLTKDLEASATDPEALQRLGSELEELQTELEAKEMRWLELSEYL
jgi:ATPase components of ABC transporters with duplicated ATPase domains